MTKADRDRLEAFHGKKILLHIRESVFESTRFAKHRTRQFHIKMVDKACPFFDKGKCGVYDARPTQCKTYPFWPENMNHEEFPKLKAHCPGIGVGPDRQAGHIVFDQVAADAELRKNLV